MINATIQLPRFDASFNKAIKNEIRARINKHITGITHRIHARLAPIITARIQGTLEYQSLFGGQLQAELGIPNPAVIDTIISVWASNFSVKYNSSGRSFGSLNIGLTQDDYTDVLTLPEASFFYTSGNTSGVIDWLRWLLLEGSSVIVRSYGFTGDTTRGSRTGLGVMIQRDGLQWRVPPEFAGTASDNFVLRALRTIDKDIDQLVQEELDKGL